MQTLTAAPAPAPAASPVPDPSAFAFSDIVGSTVLAHELGDERFAELIREHNRVVRGALAGRGEEAQFLGDGFMVAFPTAVEAVEWAVTVQRRLAELRARHGLSLWVRIGINAGTAVRESATWVGRAVIVARRLCELAEPGEILATRELCGEWGATPLCAARTVGLRGLSGPVSVLRVAW